MLRYRDRYRDVESDLDIHRCSCSYARYMYIHTIYAEIQIQTFNIHMYNRSIYVQI